MKDYVNGDKLQEFANKMHAKQKTIFAMKSEVGSPLVASTVAEMTDTERIYVYVGSESGYTSGNWYYYNGSAWTSGGVYNSTAFETDNTLEVQGAPADAKAVGDALALKQNNLTFDNTPTSGSNNPVKSGGVYTAINDAETELSKIETAINYRPIVVHENMSIDTYGSSVIVLPSKIKPETGWACTCVPCKEGDTFIITGLGGYATRLWAFSDSNGSVLSVSASGASGTNVAITAPENAAYFAFNSNMSNIYYPYNVYMGEPPIKVINSISDRVDNINTSFGKTEVILDVSFDGADNGHFISNSGGYESSASFAITVPFSLKKGYTLDATVCGYNGAVAVIASYSGGTYTPLVVDDGSTLSKTYSYTATEDLTIVISYSKNKTFAANMYLKIYDAISEQSKDTYYGMLFPRIAVVGDSLSSGVLVENSNTTLHVYGDSWLSYIAKRINATARNHYAEGGLTCKTWLSTYLTKLQSDDASNAYFIALGTNDAYLYDIGEPGSYPIGDITDEAGANTFVGYYKQIVNAVHTKAPNAVLFCVSNYNSNTLAHQYSDMIEAIANLYEYCFYVDFIGNTKVYTSTGGVWSNIGHFTTVGYAYVASIIYDLVNKIVDNNKAFFKWFGKENSDGGQFET